MPQLPTKKFEKGELIFIQDEEPTCAYLVEAGIVKVYDITNDGEERLIAFKTKGVIFSLGWLFSKHPRALYFYEAITDAKLRKINKEGFDNLIKNPKFAQQLISFLINEHIEDGLRFNALGRSSSHEKILYLLRNFCLTYGSDESKDVVKIDIPLRQQDIANFLGLRRETVALELINLRKLGILSYSKNIYTVMTDKLNNLLSGQYNSEVAIKNYLG